MQARSSSLVSRINGGFTLVELVMVMLLVSILAVYVAPRVFDRSDIATVVYQDRAMSILRNMQTRAMQDTRSNVNGTGLGYCYQVNLTENQLGIPANNFSSANSQAAIELTCDKQVIDTSDPAQLFYIGNLDGATLVATSSLPFNSTVRPTISAIRFDSLGRAVGLAPFATPPNDELSCAPLSSGDDPCVIQFVGQTSSRVCIEAQGYIYEC